MQIILLIILLLFQNTSIETTLLEIAKVVIPSAITGYICYRAGKPKTNTDIFTILTDKINKWINDFETAKIAHLATLDELATVRRELASCKGKSLEDSNLCIKKCLDGLGVIETRLNELPETQGNPILGELRAIRQRLLLVTPTQNGK